jgi:hypothetical protein
VYSRESYKSTVESKGQDSHIINATKLSERVSVYQLESSTPGLIAQLKGIPNTKRYKYVTVFVDNYVRFTYVQLQQYKSLDETLQAKKDFELMTERLGVKILDYHDENS